VRLAPGFAILVVLDGRGQLESEGEATLALQRGSAVLIPHAAGETTVSGPLVAVRCRPPSVRAALADGLELV